MTPREAVARAFWTVQIPSYVLLLAPLTVFIIATKLGYVPSRGAGGLKWFFPAFLLSFVGGWLAWSLLVPKWRLWAYERVHDIAELKRQAVAAQLIWPEGHFFERTEIASPALRARLRELEASRRDGMLR